MTIQQTIQSLTVIPGVEKSIANDLYYIGIRCVDDLKGKNPQALYDDYNKFAGCIQDRCLLYVFRCAVYFAQTPQDKQDREQLKWWNLKDKK